MQEIDIEQVSSNAPVLENLENAECLTSFGKFKSADSLLNAYNSLEKEFTKKCQQVKKLDVTTDIVAADVDIKTKIDKLFQAVPTLVKFADEISTVLPENENNLEKAIATVLSGKIVEPSNLINDEQFLTNYVYNNECVTGKIIAKYLDELSNQKTAKSIKNRGQISLSPPHRPKSIEEAGVLAKTIINNRRI